MVLPLRETPHILLDSKKPICVYDRIYICKCLEIVPHH